MALRNEEKMNWIEIDAILYGIIARHDNINDMLEEAQKQFGFLMNAFEFGAPPHGGLAFGFDRLCAVLNGVESIRDFIAFPKNNSGRDVMLDSPSTIAEEQLKELQLIPYKSDKD